MTAPALDLYLADLRLAKLSEITIRAKLRILRHLEVYVGGQLFEATADDIRNFQHEFAHLMPASVNIYSRHIKGFYDWASKRRFVSPNPVEDLVIAAAPRGRPHPTKADDLRTIFACTPSGTLRICYVLATFAGLRRGEICRLHRRDIDFGHETFALIHGKGGKERRVPFVAPVVTELYEHGTARGWVIHEDGRPWDPDRLSATSSRHLKRELGLDTTLHSMRHAFATDVAHATKDVLLVRDLLGHESLVSSQIYMDSQIDDAHERLAALTAGAVDYLAGGRLRHLRSV